MTRTAVVACCTLLLAGCAAEPIYVPLSPWHPASPWAPESHVPPPSATLKVHPRDQMPRHPDWQIPGIRNDEMHGHATGPFPMSAGGMDHGGHSPGHSMDHSMDHKPRRKPGMVKMAAPEHIVDYTPAGAHPASLPGAAMPEHEPELHLDHVPRERLKAPTQQAPIAPPGKTMSPIDDSHDHHGHSPAPAAAPSPDPAPAHEHEHEPEAPAAAEESPTPSAHTGHH